MKTSTQLKKIKNGTIVKLIQKTRLRDDITCGIVECSICPNVLMKDSLTMQSSILFLDSDLILNQIDAIKNFTEIDNAIIFQSEYLAVTDK